LTKRESRTVYSIPCNDSITGSRIYILSKSNSIITEILSSNSTGMEGNKKLTDQLGHTMFLVLVCKSYFKIIANLIELRKLLQRY